MRRKETQPPQCSVRAKPRGKGHVALTVTHRKPLRPALPSRPGDPLLLDIFRLALNTSFP